MISGTKAIGADAGTARTRPTSKVSLAAAPPALAAGCRRVSCRGFRCCGTRRSSRYILRVIPREDSPRRLLPGANAGVHSVTGLFGAYVEFRGLCASTASDRTFAAEYFMIEQERPDASAKLALLDMANNWLALAKPQEKNAETALVYETPLRAYIRQYSQDERG